MLEWAVFVYIYSNPASKILLAIDMHISIQILSLKLCPRTKFSIQVCCHMTVLVTTPASIFTFTVLLVMLKCFYTVTLHQGFWYTSVYLPIDISPSCCTVGSLVGALQQGSEVISLNFSNHSLLLLVAPGESPMSGNCKHLHHRYLEIRGCTENTFATIHVAVPDRIRILFHHVFRAHHRV